MVRRSLNDLLTIDLHADALARQQWRDFGNGLSMSRLARELRIHIVAGSITERGDDSSRSYNTSVLLGPDGARMAVYRKIHLFDVDLPGRVTVRESDSKLAGADVVCAETSLGAIAPGHTGLVYDALEVVQHDSAQYDSEAFSARIEPAIFYRQTTEGLSEVVDVFTNAATLPKSGTVELLVNGRSYSQPYANPNEFGEQRLEFNLPEWNGAAKATVRLGDFSTTPVSHTPAKK